MLEAEEPGPAAVAGGKQRSLRAHCLTLGSAATLFMETLVSGSFYYTVQRRRQESLRQEVKDAKVTSEPPRMFTHLLKQQHKRQTHSWGGEKKTKTDRVWNLPAFCCLISPSQASLNCVESQPGADIQKPADAFSPQGLVSRLGILTRGSLRIISLQTFWYPTCW